MKTMTPLQPRQLMLTAIAPLAAAILMALPASSMAGVELVVNFAPPPIPVYEQPAMPGDGYIWTPGYWAYSDDDYYWVPGTWIRPPRIGVLWTPGYWAYDGGRFAFRDGYWGEHIGFYGGVNYGYGYGGRGYEGGYWNRGAFYYNRNVNAMGTIRVRNVYERNVVNNITINRISYNGGPGGVNIVINNDERRAEHDRHELAVADQQHNRELASQNRELRAKANHGAPPIAATSKPGVFEGPGVARAKAAAAADQAADKPRADAAASAGQDTAKSRDEAQAKANASNRNDAKPRDAAHAKFDTPAASGRDAPKARDEATVKTDAPASKAIEHKPRDAQDKVEPRTARVPNAHRRAQPAPVANQQPRPQGARPMPADRPNRADNAHRADAPRNAARPDRPMRPDRPAAQPPRAPRPDKAPASGREDGKKQQ